MSNYYQAAATGEVNDYNPALGTEGELFGRVLMNRERAQLSNTREGMVDKWTRDGRVFVSGTPVSAVTETGTSGTVHVLTTPNLRYTIPAGVVVVPIHVAVSVITVIAKRDVFNVLVSDTATYTSGGGTTTHIPTAKNALEHSAGSLRSSQVTNLLTSDTALVEAAVTNVRTLKSLKRTAQASELNTSWNPEYNILKGDPMMYIVGPASFLVFIYQETTAPEFEYSMSWAELDVSSVPSVSGA